MRRRHTERLRDALLLLPLVLPLVACDSGSEAGSESASSASTQNASAPVGDRDPADVLLADYRARFPLPRGEWPGLGDATPHRRQLAAEEAELLRQLEETPSQPLRRELGRVYTMAEEHGRGMAYLVRAVDVNPRDARAWLWMGANRLSAGVLEEARVLLNRALSLQAGDPRIHRYLGEVFKRGRDLERARASFEEAVRIAPDYVEALIELGVLYEEEGRDAEARESFEGILELVPDNIEALYSLARIEDRAGNEALAIALRQRHARATILNDMGVLYGDVDEATQAAYVGIYYLENGMANKALPEFEAALAGATESAVRLNALIGRASSLIELDELDAAQAALEELNAFSPGHGEFGRLTEKLLAKRNEG